MQGLRLKPHFVTAGHIYLWYTMQHVAVPIIFHSPDNRQCDQCYFRRKKLVALGPEEVVLDLVQTIPRLLYELECYALPKSASRLCCRMFLNETTQN